MNGAELFIMIVLLIPVYGLLIWSYKEPEDSYFFGRRWMFKEEPELSEEAIDLHKKVSLITIVVLTLILVLSIYRSF